MPPVLTDGLAGPLRRCCTSATIGVICGSCFLTAPYRCLYHPSQANLLCAGRLIHTDRGAFGAVRVMVNTNQMGEAAGTAAVLALRAGVPVAAVDTEALRRSLADGGSVVL